MGRGSGWKKRCNSIFSRFRRTIVEAHEGRIWVDTEYREGASICFALSHGRREEWKGKKMQ